MRKISHKLGIVGSSICGRGSLSPEKGPCRAGKVYGMRLQLLQTSGIQRKKEGQHQNRRIEIILAPRR